MLPPAPLSHRTPAAVVWTGSEVVVWGDMSRARRPAQREGAAYDPVADTWRELPAAPFALNLAEAVWTGEEVIVFGALLDGRNYSASPHAKGLAYDPEGDSWRVMKDYPLSPQASSVTWTGKDVLAWDYELAAGAYDPAKDSWRRIARPPLRFSECYPHSALLVETVLAWFCGEGASFDIAAGKWHRIPSAPGEVHGRPVSAGSVALFAADRLWAYRP
jgi:hypothetical protein